MRRAGVIAILLILLIVFAGCGQRVPTRNTTPKNPWGNTTPNPQGTGGSNPATPVVPTTTSPVIQATLMTTATGTPVPTNRNPPPVANSTANLTIVDEKNMVFVYNRTAFNYNLKNPPLLIEYTLTVPNITKTRVVTDPVSGSDSTVTITYPDPAASFEVTVKDLGTKRILAQNGYGGHYDVAYNKQIWIRYPGNYYIEFFGTRLTADVKFWVTNGS
jgi:hypothetical protein